MQSSSDFSSLRALAQVLGRVTAILLMAVLFACVGGILAGLTTFFVYFLGLYIGIPVGAFLGCLIGMKTSFAEAIFIFGLTGLTWLGAGVWAQTADSASLDSFLAGGAAALAGAIVAIVTYFSRQRVPENVKIFTGIASTGGLFILAAVSFLRMIYR